jgi:hypothetical protein
MPESVIDQFPTFYAVRPELLSEDERQAFAEKYPDLVEKFADCWNPEPEESED